MLDYLPYWLPAAAVFAALGYWVALQKRRPPIEGILLGAIFAPFGVLLVALLPTGDRRPKPVEYEETPPDLSALGIDARPKPQDDLVAKIRSGLAREREDAPEIDVL